MNAIRVVSVDQHTISYCTAHTCIPHLPSVLVLAMMECRRYEGQTDGKLCSCLALAMVVGVGVVLMASIVVSNTVQVL